ncbi:MAG: GNAT family N-acetyltransferase [Rhizomicrobium sp.]
MNAAIRKAQRADAKPLSELAKTTYANAFGHSLGPTDLSAHLDNNLSEACFEEFLDEDTILLAEREGRLIGFIQIGVVWPESDDDDFSPDDAELRRVYVLSEFQGNGIGRQLIDAAFREPRFALARDIYLDVWEDNQRAQKLYECYGFRAIGKRAFIVESGAKTGFDIIMIRRAG